MLKPKKKGKENQTSRPLSKKRATLSSWKLETPGKPSVPELVAFVELRRRKTQAQKLRQKY
uniref:Uncharacterized protein n=1 Tax=Rhizophora mucronata TaxID=61149 RepID=A0A2P2Q0W6_RHIMU